MSPASKPASRTQATRKTAPSRTPRPRRAPTAAPGGGLDLAAEVTRRQALDALESSAAAVIAVVEQSLASGGKVKGFPAGAVRFAGYLLAHEAHHRGQISSLARMSGHPISQKTMFALWEWGKRG